MIQPKDELIRDAKISGIKKQVAECINAAFSKGYETCFEQKKEIEDRAYQRGLEDGRRQGEAIDGDKRYWDGYHAAQEDGKKIYQKGLDDAWTVIRKIALDDEGLTYDELYDIFGDNDPYRILETLSPSEAIEKIREYEEEQKRYCVTEWDSDSEACANSPCHLCRFNPPGSGDGKPCSMCPAEGKVKE